MWWCECKAATRRGASSGYSWPHHGPVVEGRCFSQVSINWRDVARHIGFPWSQHLLLPHILKYLPTTHYYPLDLTGAIQAHWSGEALECHAVMVQLSALIKTVTLVEIVIPTSLLRLGADVGGCRCQCP